MDLSIPKELDEIRAKAKAFVDEVAIPAEDHYDYDHGRMPETIVQKLREEAKKRGLWTFGNWMTLPIQTSFFLTKSAEIFEGTDILFHLEADFFHGISVLETSGFSSREVANQIFSVSVASKEVWKKSESFISS